MAMVWTALIIEAAAAFGISGAAAWVVSKRRNRAQTADEAAS